MSNMITYCLYYIVNELQKLEHTEYHNLGIELINCCHTINDIVSNGNQGGGL
jgi:hypothetical protein